MDQFRINNFLISHNIPINTPIKEQHNMSHFAKIENGIVTQVIVVEQDVLDTGLWGDPAAWVQTSYNTSAGHTSSDCQLPAMPPEWYQAQSSITDMYR